MTLLEKLRELNWTIYRDYGKIDLRASPIPLIEVALQNVVDGMIADAVKEVAAERDEMKKLCSYWERLYKDCVRAFDSMIHELRMDHAPGTTESDDGVGMVKKLRAERDLLDNDRKWMVRRHQETELELDRLRKIEAAAKAYRDFGIARSYSSKEFIRFRDAACPPQPEPPPKLVWELAKDHVGNDYFVARDPDYYKVFPLYQNNEVQWHVDPYRYGVDASATADEAKTACEKHAAEQAKVQK